MSWLRLMEQNISQNELAETGAPLEEASIAPSLKKNRVFSLIKEMWPAYLIEVLVIIVGISITLAMEKWRDNSREEQLEKIYEKNLLSDVVADMGSLGYAINSTQKIVSKGSEILDYLKSPQSKNISSAQVISDIHDIIGRPKFTTRDATFSDLKNSGNLHLLKDIGLKNSLFAYYSVAQNIKDLQDAEQLATINISGPYFLKRFPLDDLADQDQLSNSVNFEDLPKNIEFRNNVLLRVKNREELLVVYQQADSLSAKLKNALYEITK
jgi:hypothetical protein